jgi:hypothetical protein
VTNLINEVSERRTCVLIKELRELIEVDGYRRREIARVLGVHPREVHRWFLVSHGCRPSVEDALALADLSLQNEAAGPATIERGVVRPQIQEFI